MLLFATLSARRPPRQLSPYRRGMRSCRYLRHLRHLAFSHAIHGFPRAPDPVHICYTFYTSAPGAPFPVKQGYAILSIFATLAAPNFVTRRSRTSPGIQSCVYLLRILHFRLGQRLPRNLRPSNLMHICYTFPRRRLWDQFGVTFWGVFCLGAVSSVASFTRFRKFARGGCNAYQLRVGSHARVYFSKKNNIEKGLTPTPFTSSLHVSHAGSI